MIDWEGDEWGESAGVSVGDRAVTVAGFGGGVEEGPAGTIDTCGCDTRLGK